MANITHKITLSTTRDNYDVGTIKVRRADDETQIFDVEIIEDGKIKPFAGLTPFFCLMAREITGQGVSEEPVKTFDASKGTLKHILSANAFQMVGRNEAYFSFRKELSTGEWVEQYSTRSFYYTVEKSIYTEPFKDSNYWFTFKELYRLFNQYMEDGKASWEDFFKNGEEAWQDFVDSNREILESIDPGGVILGEIVGLQKDSIYDENHPTADDRVKVSEGLLKGKIRQTSGIGDFMYRLRNTTDVLKVVCQGDSLTYGYDISSADRRPPATTTTDDGTAHTRERATISYPEYLQELFDLVFPNRVLVTNKGFSGDTTTTGAKHWNVSNADLIICMYGTNDSKDPNFDRFLDDYRKIVLREQQNNTAVLMLTPPKRRVANGSDLAPYRNTVIQLSKELNVPYVDMMDECANLNQSYYSDATHFNGDGYKFLGAKVFAILTGESVANPRKVSNTFLGLRDQIDGVKFGASGTASWMTGASSPTPSEVTENVGVGASLTANQDDTKGFLYSFYTSEDNVVIYPSAYISPVATGIDLELILDFETGGIGMSNSIADQLAQTQYEPPQKISYGVGDQTYSTDLTAYGPNYLSAHHVNYWTDKKLIIPKKGWHTVFVRNRSAESAVNFFGLYAMPLDTFNATKMANTPARIDQVVSASTASFAVKITDLNAVLRTAIKAKSYTLSPILKITVKTTGRATAVYYVQLSTFASGTNRILTDPNIYKLNSSVTEYRTLTSADFNSSGELVVTLGGTSLEANVSIEVG